MHADKQTRRSQYFVNVVKQEPYRQRLGETPTNLTPVRILA